MRKPALGAKRRVRNHRYSNRIKIKTKKRRIHTAERLEDRHLLAAMPIGYWTFDDGADLGADSSGNANDLLNFGGVSSSANGVTGGALALDGTGYLGGIDPVGLPAGNDSFSIAAWIKPTTTGEKGIVGWGDFNNSILRETTLGLSNDNGLRHDWGIADLTATGTEVTNAGVDLDDGQWHHVVASSDGEERTLWLDGEKLTSAAAPIHFVANQNFRIGSSCLSCNNELFDGLLDDVAVWDAALDANQVAALFLGTSPLELREAGLVSQWVADDLTAGFSDGESIPSWTENVFGTIATASGNVTLETDELNGHAVTRFSPSDGNDQLRVVAADNPLSGVADFSVAIVFRAASSGIGETTGWEDNTGLVDTSQLGTTNDWGLALNRDGQVGAGLGGPDVTAYSPGGASFANGQAHVAVYSRFEGITALYVDDFSPVVRSDGGASLRGVFDLTVGSLQTDESYFNGDVAEIHLYNKALSVDEANELTSQLITKYAIEPPTVPIRIAGELLVDLRATDPTAGTESWRNAGSLGDFDRVGDPTTEVIAGVASVSFNSDHPAAGWDDAYAGPIAPANITGNGTRSIEVWAYNPNDGLQNNEETAVAWGRRGGPAGSNLSFGYGNHGTWGAVGHWGAPDMPWFPGGGSPDLGQWHHLVYTFDGSTARVYADGVLANSEAVGILGTHANTTINLAAQNGGGGFLSLTEGQPGSLSLANVRIHSGVLSDADVTGNFAAGIQVAGDPPETQPESYDVDEDVTLVVNAANGVLANDTDPNELDLTAVVEEATANGTLVLNIDGSFTYIPNANFHGVETFAYRATNGNAPSEPVTVTINVQPLYDAAVAMDDNYVVDTNQNFSTDASLGVLANDENIDGLPLTAVLTSDQTAGQLTLGDDGSFTYDPQGVRGSQTFSYRIDDTVSLSNAVVVTLLVDAPPVADDDNYSIDEDGELIVTAADGVLSGDTDAESDSLTANLVTNVAHGDLTLNFDGSFSYTPAGNFFGTDSFQYLANDGDQNSDVATVTINVNSVNDSPVAVDDTFFGFENQLLIRGAVQGVLANDVDVDGPTLTTILVDAPAVGDLAFNDDGSFVYTPDDGFLGSQTFTYRVSDSLVESGIATVTLLINSLDQQIVINEIHYDPADNTIREGFIELYNAGSSPVDLSDWFFSAGVQYTFPSGTVMAPDSFLVIAEDPATLGSQFSVTAVGPWSGTLTNDGENVTLRNALGDVVDEVDYGVGFPWPTGAAGEGGSMELIHPILDNDLGGSWRVSQVDNSQNPVEPVTVVPEFSDSRYLVPNDDSLGTSWTTVEFNDAAWDTGGTGLGYENNPADYAALLRTNVRPVDVAADSTSIFLRIPFTIDDLSLAGRLRLRMKYDDGFVAYINGTEVARANVTGNPPSFGELAANHPDSAAVVFEDFDISNADALLTEGPNNVLAIQGVNATLLSSDMLVLPELIIPGSEQALADPTPGERNSVFAENAPPQSRQVDHSPNEPTSGDDTVVTMKVTDPDGVTSVNLQYQVVVPGQYIPAFLPVPISTLLQAPDTPPEPNPAYSDPANWTTITMVDDGVGADRRAGDGTYTATIPAQGHRTLVRYRMAVEDSQGASDRLPYADDPSLNFAYFVYDGIPDYETNQGTFSGDVLESLPVYQFLTRSEDMTEVLAYNGADQIAQGPDARFVYNWPGTMVYDGEVYDNIKYRLRGANGRYHAAGKRSMRFRFNKGNYFQARDQDGDPFPNRWRTLTTGKGFENRQTLTYGLNEALSLHLYDELGLPTQETHWVHFRVIDEAAEAPDQWHGDFWGLNFILETYDVRFLEGEGMEKGNLYKLINSRTDADSQQRYQAPNAVSNGADHNNIESSLTGSRSADWLDAHVDLDNYYVFHALAEAIRHYDFWPSANKNMVYYFSPEYTEENNDLGKLSILPWDTDASWGPTWNSGHDVVYNGLFPASGGGSDGNSTPELWPAYFNVVREIRDLLWQPDQIEPLIDEFAVVIDDFVVADSARWKNAPSTAGNYNGLGGAGATSLAALAQDLKNFAFSGGSWPGGGVGAGGRAAHLDSLQGSNGEAAEIPFTPTIGYIGDPEFATNGLTFQTSNFTDPQGQNTFATMEWRVAEVTNPDAPAYDPNEKFKLEWNATWETELATFNSTVDVPAGVIDAGRTYRARVRMQDTTGRWSHWSDPVEFTTTPPDNTQLLHEHFRITEVHFNPLGPTGAETVAGFDNNDDFEFIELVNTSTTATLDLAGAEFSDGVEFDFTGSDVTSLLPGERVVIVEDVDAFQFRYGAGVSIAGSWSGALSNSGEGLVLDGPDGNPILDFTFAANDDWPGRADGDGSSLQIVDVGGDYNDATNWRASTQIHGSPDAAPAEAIAGVVINEILAHTDPPQVDAVELYNPTDLPVNIGGWFLSDSNRDLDALAKFQIPAGAILGPRDYIVFDESDFNADGGLNPNDFAFSSTGDEAWLTVGTGFQPTFFVDDVSFGGTPTGESIGRVPNGEGLFAPQWRVTLGNDNGVPRVGPLVISELMYAPLAPTEAELAIEPSLDAEDFEFAEISNPTSGAVDLRNWELAGGIDFAFPAGISLAANSALVILRFDPDVPANAGKVEAFASRYGVNVAGNQAYLGGYRGRLSDVGERVELRRFVADPTEDYHVLDDGVIYDTQAPWPDDASANGQSIQRLSPTYWGSAPHAWVAASPSPTDVSFSIAVPGDVTGDGEVTADDIDTLLHVAAAGTTVSHYDVNNDGTVDDADVRFVVQDILGTFMGDVNLDGRVDAGDLNSVGIAWRIDNASGWRQGDVTGDGHVNSADLNVIGLNWQSGVAAAAPAHGRVPRAPLQAVAIAPRYAVDVPSSLTDRAFMSLGSADAQVRERLNSSSLPVSGSEYGDYAEGSIAFGNKHRVRSFRATIGSTHLDPGDDSRGAKSDADQIRDIDALFADDGLL